MNQLKLKTWMEKQLWNTREEGPVVKLVVRHLDAGGRAGKIEVWSQEIPHEADSVTIDEGELPDIVQEIQMAAFDDAEGMAAGLQRYQVLSYVKHKPHAHSRFTFTMSGGNDDVDDTGVSEPATTKGHLAQLMRHTEALMRTTVMSTNQNMAMLTRTVASQNDHIELVEDLKSQQHDRNLKTIQMENQEKRYAEMFDKATLLLPAVVNRVAGKKLLPENVSPMQDMLKNLAESLTEEQLAKILPTLKPEQQIALLEFMETSQGANKPLQLVTTNNKSGS